MTRRSFLSLLLLAYLVLATTNSVVVPLFEAPDEHHHYFAVEWYAVHRRLPVIGAQPEPWIRQEAAQPPLYYLIGALVLAPLSPDPALSREAITFNPYVRLEEPAPTFNANVFVRQPDETSAPRSASSRSSARSRSSG